MIKLKDLILEVKVDKADKKKDAKKTMLLKKKYLNKISDLKNNMTMFLSW